ncbi:hypothetical protein H0H92_004403 [Tricholoma furcatifolium]|nr:hypothetical protein H0H92_004403 [Tricholoma furcatifolium]
MFNRNRSPSPFPVSTCSERSLLLATVSSLNSPHFLSPVIAAAASTTRTHLTIVLFSRHFNDPRPTSSNTFRGVSRTESFEDVCRFLTYVYVQATSVAQSLDKVLMEIDVLLLGLDGDVPSTLGKGVDIVFRVAGDSIPIPLPAHLSSLRQSYLTAANHDSIELPSPSSPSSPTTIPSNLRRPARLPVVAIGGTFDHLHAGHKILLSMASWITSEKIIVGVTDDALLTKKSNAQLLQSLEERMERVRAFLSLFRPGIEYYIVPLQDVCGPTGYDPNVQGLVVSHETISGSEAIAAVRNEKGLSELQTFVIDVISPHSPAIDPEDMELLRNTKMSSTFIRQWMVDKAVKEEAVRAKEVKEQDGVKEPKVTEKENS